MTAAALRQVSSHQELVAAVGGDPFVRYEIAADLPRPAWALGRSAVMFRDTHSGLRGVAAIGEPDELAVLLGDLADQPEIANLQTVTVARAALATIAQVLPIGDSGGDWDWMWTDVAPPAQPAEDRLVVLDDVADADELIALNSADNPTAESEPGTGRTEVWLGIRDAKDAIIAAGALHRNAAGTPHLTGIVTAADHRGRGLGAAVTAGLTRIALEVSGRFAGVSSLGVYAGNDGARRIYRRLGYRTAQKLASRRMTTPDRGPARASSTTR
ncbi:GNAT family N-acetyltransferase [Nakamurella lactea]|uniref:GNAT family N-acetyltransferase n=1 Tax=Nakamurella lactea TaxID=459515 RepID=UPI00041B6A71|nr:GNAT family N-acetyltransferase [Nakamurella lactea]